MKYSLLIKICLYGTGLSWNTEDRYAPPKEKGSHSKTKREKTAKSIAEARKRRIARLSKLFARLLRQPKWFIHLNFDRAVKRDWDVDECRKVFEKFRGFLDKNYPESWFIWVIDESDKTGVHYHLFGTFHRSSAEWEHVRDKWLELTGSKNKKMFGYKEYTPEQFSYITGAKKSRKTRSLLWKLGRQSFWGLIHRKNVKLATDEAFPAMPFEVWLDILPELKDRLAKANEGRDYADRLVKFSGCLNFGMTPEIASWLRNRIVTAIEQNRRDKEIIRGFIHKLMKEVGVTVLNRRNLPS